MLLRYILYVPLVGLQFMSLPSHCLASLLIAFPLAAAANSHKCHVRQFVICVKDAAANGNATALESFCRRRWI